MGVKNLWALLEPVGRRINVEALTGKILAVDASIWLIQFLKAMRDDRGDPMKNAHLLGFFRRICRLLFHRIRPVFVFDGATPALKRRTVIARRRRREQHTSKLRKTAEKLLMNQLKQHALTNLVGDGVSISKPKKPKKRKTTKNAGKDQEETDPGKRKSCEAVKEALPSGEVDLSRSAADEGPSQPCVPSGGFIPNDDSVIAEDPTEQPASNKTTEMELDDSDGDSSDFALDLPDDLTTLDPEVLFTLPPSIQYDVILQMREKQFGENRETFVSLTGQPENFSDHQMATYLKASEFRRKLEDTRKQVGQAMGINGAQVQKIASEPNRSYVFQTNLDDGKNSSLTKLSSEGATVSAMLQLQKPTQNETLPPTPVEDPSIPTRTLDITFEVPQSSSSEEQVEWEDEDSEEDKDDASNGNASVPPPLMPPTVTRQKFWSLSHGFKMGRSLGQWGVNEGEEEEMEGLDGNDNTNFDNEDAQLQEALRRSIQDVTGKSGTREVPFRIVEGGANQVEADETRAQSPASQDFVLPTPGERRYSDEGPSMASPQPTRMQKNVQFVESDSEKLKDVKEKRTKAGTEAMDFDFLDAYVDTENLGGEPKTGADVQEEVVSRVVAPTAADMGVLETEPGASSSLPSRGDDASAGKASFSPRIPEKKEWQCTNVEMETHRNNVQAAGKDFEVREKPVENRVVNAGGSGPGCFDPVAREEGTLLSINARTTALPFSNMGPKSPILAEAESPPETSIRNSHQVLEGVDADVLTSSHCGEDIPSKPPKDRSMLSSTGIQQIPAAIAPPSIPKSSEGKLPVPVERTGQQNGVSPETLEQSERRGHDEETQEELEPVAIEEELALLQTEGQFLEEQQKRLTRHAETPTPQMYAECQELLQMFGLPYIIAPMEAEAQCAFLNGAGLVDGVVTEDNDVFLFGGRMVYKNLFENKKYVEEYNMKDIESELGLDQERLIQMAMLLGSDYTEGISGIGIVNATEVVQAFSGPDGPKAFRDWVNSPDEHLVSAALASTGEGSGAAVSGLEADDPGLRQFKITHRAARKNWELPESFPNPAVVEAYITPKIDGSKEKFTFGRPDLEMLRSFCSERFGWDNSKVDELLVPVLKAYDQRQTQLRIDSFISFRERFAKIKSKRLQKAVAGITGTENAEIALGQAEAPPDHATVGKKRKARGNVEGLRESGTGEGSGKNGFDPVTGGAPETCTEGPGRKARGGKSAGKSSSRRAAKQRQAETQNNDGGDGAHLTLQKEKKRVKPVAKDSEEEMDTVDHNDSDTQAQEAVLPVRSLPSRKTRLDVSYLEADDSGGEGQGGGDDPDWGEG